MVKLVVVLGPVMAGGLVSNRLWTDHFYVQGMFSFSAFEGSQSRNIVSLTDDLGGKTASGDKSATSYATAFRVGAPFQTGNLLLEPQFTLAWTQNQEDGFSENGADNLFSMKVYANALPTICKQSWE